jgi:hypothetical protein
MTGRDFAPLLPGMKYSVDQLKALDTVRNITKCLDTEYPDYQQLSSNYLVY